MRFSGYNYKGKGVDRPMKTDGVSKNKRRLSLDVLRIILTVLVVIGHGSYYSNHSIFGGGY